MRVLLVDSDEVSVRRLAHALHSCDNVVDHVKTGEEALDLLRHYDYGVVVLELALADMEGYDVLRRMRAARLEAPVVVLSGQSQPERKVKALELGADDFVTKPFDCDELIARLHAVMRRSRGYSEPTLRVGALQLNLSSQEVLVNSLPVHLTGREYSMLKLLVLRKGMVLTKEMFLDHLYCGIDEPEMKIIDVFICKLRKKLAQAGADNVIGTVWGRGYTIRDHAVKSASALQSSVALKSKVSA